MWQKCFNWNWSEDWIKFLCILDIARNTAENFQIIFQSINIHFHWDTFTASNFLNQNTNLQLSPKDEKAPQLFPKSTKNSSLFAAQFHPHSSAIFTCTTNFSCPQRTPAWGFSKGSAQHKRGLQHTLFSTNFSLAGSEGKIARGTKAENRTDWLVVQTESVYGATATGIASKSRRFFRKVVLCECSKCDKYNIFYISCNRKLPINCIPTSSLTMCSAASLLCYSVIDYCIYSVTWMTKKQHGKNAKVFTEVWQEDHQSRQTFFVH